MVRMIVVHCHLRSKPQHRDETVAALVAVQEATRERDPGCLHYAYLADLQDPNAFTCVEEWTDAESLAAHVASPHVAECDAVLARTADGPEQISVFAADPTRFP
ncbi:MAG TPA: putative quinol monooxygenase [Mycobacteriales bacterium]|nr:putative quinol monooxygenase [Mycobacteriales bacterium]